MQSRARPCRRRRSQSLARPRKPTSWTAKPPVRLTRFEIEVASKDDSGCVGIEFSVSVSSQFARNMETELKQILDDLGLGERIRVERSRVKSPGNNE